MIESNETKVLSSNFCINMEVNSDQPFFPRFILVAVSNMIVRINIMSLKTGACPHRYTPMLSHDNRFVCFPHTIYIFII